MIDRSFFIPRSSRDQFQVALGRSMLFGNGLSALLTLMVISGGLLILFVVGPLALTGRQSAPWMAGLAGVLWGDRRRLHVD